MSHNETPAATEPQTVTELAEVLGVNRRQISKWRSSKHEQLTAPTGLSLREWSHWLRRTARSTWAARADARLAEIEAAQGVDLGGPLPTYPAEGNAAEIEPNRAPPAGGAGTDWADLPADASDAQRKARADAQRAELSRATQAMELEKALGNLLPIATLQALSDAIGALLAESLSAGVWAELSPLLDGLDGGLRRRIREAHNAGILRIRRELAADIREKLNDLVREQIR